MTRLEFHFDFGSPNAYLSHLVIPAIEARIGARFDYVPVLLGGVFRATSNRSPMESMAGIRNKPDYERLEMNRFLVRHGITQYKRNPFFPVNTLAIMRGAIVADDEGVLDDYIDTVNRGMWEDGLKMDDPEVIVVFLSANGFDGPALLARTQDTKIKAKLVANTEAAVARGVFGIPTFFVGEAMFFGKDRLSQVEEALLA